MAEPSAREVQVMELVGRQLSNPEIAARLHISVRTVESHVGSLVRKLKLANRRALAAYEVERAAAAKKPPEVQTDYVQVGGAYIAYQVMGAGPWDALLVADGFIPMETMLEEPSLRAFWSG